jgi:NAD dependent epimerase/dehydratase
MAVRQKIFLTGADGFIGSHLAESLVKYGHDVKSLCQYNSFGHQGWLDDVEPSIRANMEIFAGDIRDGDHMNELAKGCDVIFHLAALIAIPFSYQSPRSYLETNAVGTLNLIQAARKQNVEKFIHTSTSEVYGTAQFVPITEHHPLQGQSPYSASKIAADQMAYSFFSAFDTPITIIRPFNTYGPRQSTRAIIPTIITQLARGERNLKLGALTPTRDFNFVEDTVAGFVATLNADNIAGKTINLGSNFEISIKDTVEAIADVFGTSVSITHDRNRLRPEKSEVERLLASNEQALILLNWSPKYGGILGFKEGLKKTVSWFTDDANLRKYKDQGYST